MFDQFQGPTKHEPRWFGVKMLIVSAVVMLLSLGLCGVGAALPGYPDGFTMTGFFGFLASALLIVVAAIVTVIEILVASGRNLTERIRDRNG